jgi:glycosyltransferase involved in cell wall biosynthesis
VSDSPKKIKPIVSVITIVRNDSKGLTRTLESVFAQEAGLYESIVVDGASTDGTVDVIRGYEKNISKWVSEADRGIYDAMNKGAAMASGEWIVYMNAGDVFRSPDVLANLLPELTGEVEVVMGGVEEVLLDKYETRSFIRHPKPIQSVWKHLPTCHQSIFIRRELQQTYRFDTSYTWCADQELFARLHRDGKRFHATEQIISVYDCAGGRARDPMMYIRERWRLSQGLAPLPNRFWAFGREWVHCRLWGPVAKGLRCMMTDGMVKRIRRLRGTGGNNLP